jgi:hypothetical protein
MDDFPEEYLTTEGTDYHGLINPCLFREHRVIRGKYFQKPVT